MASEIVEMFFLVQQIEQLYTLVIFIFLKNYPI
jgi:hypothetical protein